MRWAFGRSNVRMIGVDIDAIEITENRERFRDLMESMGIPMAPQATAKSFLEGKEAAQQSDFHCAFVRATRLVEPARASSTTRRFR